MSTEQDTPKSRRGFKAMDPEKQRAIASKGGKAAHVVGRAHEFSPDEARTAGRAGGQKVAANRQHMAEIGRIGGLRRAENARRRLTTAPVTDYSEPMQQKTESY